MARETFGRDRTLIGLAVALLLVAGGLVDATEAPAATLDLVPFGSVWSFDDRGVDLGSGWRAPGFADGGWSSGAGELGYGDGDESTVVSFGGDPAFKHATTYFRRSFEVADAGLVSGLLLRVRRDDGVVVYLNGVEVLRDNLPAGPISASTWASTWQVSETTPVEGSVAPGLLVSGQNVLAVEMHQAWRTSSDLSFDLELTATASSPPSTTSSTSTSTTSTSTPPSTTATTSSTTTTTTRPTTTTATTSPSTSTTAPTTTSTTAPATTSTTAPTTTSTTMPSGPPVAVTWLPFGSVWSFDDRGVDLGSGWRAPGFADGGWSSGAGELGYGDGDESTVVSFGGDPAFKHATTYFRRSFEVADAGLVSGLLLRVRRDDGVVVYLNGVEVLRDNLPAGPISASTWASTWQVSETTPVEGSVAPGLLVSGQNVLAVEMHQAWRTSSDLSFDLELTATVRGSGPPPTTSTTSTSMPTATSTSTSSPTSTTVPPPSGDPALLAVGDIARCGGDHPAVAALLSGQSGTFAPLGDLAYPDGSATDFADCYDPWFGPEKARTRPVPGNHEYNTPGAAGYYAYFGSRAGDPGEGWYSYDLGGWHVIALNSECARVGGCGVGSPMYQWLQTDLASAGTPCIAAYWHHAPRSSELGYAPPPGLEPVVAALVAGGVDVLLSGHAHNYERFARLDANGAVAPDGVRQFVVGTGGNSLRAFGPAVAGSQVRSNTADGLLRLDLGVDGYAWQFLPAGGATFTDTGSDTCSPGTPQAASTGHEFSDVPAWIDEAVSWIADQDRLPPFATGYADLTFRPGLDVTRAQMARMLYRIAGSPDVRELPDHGLSDVPAWIDDAVQWLVAQGIATGFSDRTFRPDQSITRAEAARMLHRSVGSPPGRLEHGFNDVPPWVANAVAWIADPSHDPPIATGFADRTFRPGAPITRAQLARMLYRMSLG